MSRLVTAAAAVVLATLLWAGFRPVGPAPPLGPFLDPVSGVWALAGTAELPRQAAARVPGLGAGTRVLYDERGVPHIFAATVEDAIRALGYVVARDRLFQMELSARAGGGRLTELAGARAIAADETPRRLGQRWAAERVLAAMDPRSAGARALRAYADGVNAWVDAMTPADLPVEYRLLDARPARWEPIHTIELLERMAWTLSYDRLELDRARVAAVVGAAAARALFPVNSPIVEPIVPNGHRAPRIDTVPLPPPGAPDSTASRLLALRERTAPPAAADSSGLERGTVGSNGWTVAPSRSASGRALLAGDPHLDLTLPSIWYEAHLVVPGVMDAYGVTIPGAPGILIGFNRDVAWTFTNAYADAMDYWEETVDDPERPTRYRLDGAWRPLGVREERYRDPQGRVIRTDTLYLTHRGPMLREDGRWYSFRWIALSPFAELDAFAAAARATSARGLLDSMAAYYGVPAQTMLAADREGHIAVRATGQVPERPDDDGLAIRDGSTRASDWTGWRPVSRWPQAYDPPQGFLASANQQPSDPRVDSAYYGADFRDPWRAMRINALLRADSSVTPDEMRRFQTDPGSARADFFVPAFLSAAERVLARRDDASLREAARLLAEWDRRYPRESERAALFEAAMRELTDATFDELLRPGATRGQPGARVATPGGYVFVALLRDSTSAWWDDRATPAVETRDEILTASLVRGLERSRDRYGAPGGAWRWDRVHSANIHHVLGLPAFGALGLDVAGGPNTLSPTSGRGTAGASWRMVVELGPELRAWGVYPGGQSGNPASPRYADRLERWRTGVLDTLFVPRDAASFPASRVRASLLLSPEP